jgi:hypothetical protein
VLLLLLSYLLRRLNGNGVFLWDGDLHGFGGVVLGRVALDGSAKLECRVSL